MQKKIQFFFGTESLIEKTDVHPITVESDKFLQDAGGLPRGEQLVSGLLSFTGLNSAIQSMVFIAAQSTHNILLYLNSKLENFKKCMT